jgi:hypothetical protein
MVSATDSKYTKNIIPVRLKSNEPPAEIEVWTKGDLKEIFEEVRRHRAERLARQKHDTD